MTGRKITAGFIIAAALCAGSAKAYLEDRNITDHIRHSFNSASSVTDGGTAIVFAGHISRLCVGLAMLQKGAISHLHISGENMANTPEKLNKACAGNLPGDQYAFISFDNAKTTHENGLLAAAWAKKNNVTKAYLITESYHMPRSLLEMRRAMPQSTFIAKPVLSSADNWERMAERSKYLWRLVGLPGFKTQLTYV